MWMQNHSYLPSLRTHDDRDLTTMPRLLSEDVMRFVPAKRDCHKMPAAIPHAVAMYDVCPEVMTRCRGGNWPTTILSSNFTWTPVHTEEGYFGAVNDLVYGYPKLWMVVPGKETSTSR